VSNEVADKWRLNRSHVEDTSLIASVRSAQRLPFAAK
jgi:hypothetical protein